MVLSLTGGSWLHALGHLCFCSVQAGSNILATNLGLSKARPCLNKASLGMFITVQMSYVSRVISEARFGISKADWDVAKAE